MMERLFSSKVGKGVRFEVLKMGRKQRVNEWTREYVSQTALAVSALCGIEDWGTREHLISTLLRAE